MRRTLPALTILGLTMTAAAFAATPFDGTYRGEYSSIGGAGARCPAGSAMTLTIRDGQFTWRNQSDATPIQVGPDGSFSGQNGRRFVTGRVAGGKITATTSGLACNYAWSLSK
jgi:hypothetical protein